MSLPHMHATRSTVIKKKKETKKESPLINYSKQPCNGHQVFAA